MPNSINDLIALIEKYERHNSLSSIENLAKGIIKK